MSSAEETGVTEGDLARAQDRLRIARERCRAYRGASDQTRRKLLAAIRSAEADVALLRHALSGGEGAALEDTLNAPSPP